MYLELIASIVLFAATLVAYLRAGSKHRNQYEKSGLRELPGPMNFPIIGSLPTLMFHIGGNIFRKSSFEIIDQVKKRWGSPIKITFGNINGVLIDDMKTARKLMLSEDWSNRLDDNPLWYRRSFDNHYGLLVANGEGWKEMRKFVHKTLTKQGFGRTRALEMIHEIEILNFFEHLDKLREDPEVGECFDMQGLFNVSTYNILWRMVAGTKFSYNNEELIHMMKLMEEFAHGVHPREMGVLVFPWLRHFKAFSGFEMIIDNHKKMQTFFLNIINERRKSGEYKESKETFIDAFLQEIDHHRDEKIIPNHYTDEQFAMVLVDLFVTGFVPTASCLEFLILFMILHPEIQRKCHDEIDTVIGKKRFPSINDNEKMPYTQAVCLEVLRHITFIPLTTRSATKDTQIDDYFIPKGTIAGVNIYGIHHDKTKWKNPDEFDPERFLDEDGRLCNQDLILPFGTGKRVCPAEVFARVSTFTYFTYLMQRYSFEIPPHGKKPDPTPNVGMGCYVKPYKCLIRKRELVSSIAISDIMSNRDATTTYEDDDGTPV